MGGSVWVQNKIELFEGELVVFKRANSPNFLYESVCKKRGQALSKELQNERMNIMLLSLRKQNISHYNRKSPKMKKFSLSVLVKLQKYMPNKNISVSVEE